MRVIHRSVQLFLAAFFVSSVVGTSLVLAQEGVAARPLKIGIIDVRQIYVSYDKRPIFEKEIETMQATMRARYAERTEKLRNLADEIEQFEDGSEERKERMKTYQKRIAELQSFQQAAQKIRDERISEITKELYGDIDEVIKAYGKEHDYDIILKKDILEEKSYGQMELLLRIGQRIILYHKDSLDVTQDILKRVNEKYNARKAEEAKAGKVETEQPEPAKEQQRKEQKKEEQKKEEAK